MMCVCVCMCKRGLGGVWCVLAHVRLCYVSHGPFSDQEKSVEVRIENENPDPDPERRERRMSRREKLVSHDVQEH